MNQIITFIIASTLLILLPLSMRGQDEPILNGIVTARGGDPLVGCNVFIKGTTAGTVTDSCGEFSIPIETDDVIIVFHDMSYEDLRTFELKIKRKGISTEKIVFVIGNSKKKNEDCNQTIEKRLKKYRIR